MITACEKCGGLIAQPGEAFAGRPCWCQSFPATGSLAARQKLTNPQRRALAALPPGVWVSADEVGERASTLCRLFMLDLIEVPDDEPENIPFGDRCAKMWRKAPVEQENK